MSKKETIEEKTWELLGSCAGELGLMPVDAEFVKERGEYSLLIYIDKEGGITINDCEDASRLFSDKLDELDFIEEAYIMEVSSPGLGRPLKKEKDFQRSMGEEVEIRTYRPIDKQKEFYGILSAYDDKSVTITLEDDKTQVFQKVDIALIRLAIDF